MIDTIQMQALANSQKSTPCSSERDSASERESVSSSMLSSSYEEMSPISKLCHDFNRMKITHFQETLEGKIKERSFSSLSKSPTETNGISPSERPPLEEQDRIRESFSDQDDFKDFGNSSDEEFYTPPSSPLFEHDFYIHGYVISLLSSISREFVCYDCFRTQWTRLNSNSSIDLYMHSFTGMIGELRI